MNPCSGGGRLPKHLLLAAMLLPFPPAHADEPGVSFALGGERFVLTPACAWNVGHAIGEDDRAHLRFDILETPQCFEAFHGLMSAHLGERLTVSFRGETLLEADLHTPLGPVGVVLVSRHPRVAIEASRFLGDLPSRDVP